MSEHPWSTTAEELELLRAVMRMPGYYRGPAGAGKTLHPAHLAYGLETDAVIIKPEAE